MHSRFDNTVPPLATTRETPRSSPCNSRGCFHSNGRFHRVAFAGKIDIRDYEGEEVRAAKVRQWKEERARLRDELAATAITDRKHTSIMARLAIVERELIRRDELAKSRDPRTFPGLMMRGPVICQKDSLPRPTRQGTGAKLRQSSTQHRERAS